MRVAFAFHIWVAWVCDSHGFTCPSALDAETVPVEEDGRILLGTRSTSSGQASSSQQTLRAQASLADTSRQHQLMRLDGENLVPDCPVWNGIMDGNAVYYNGWYFPAWGNLLSEYWEARGAAALGGVKFISSETFPRGTWLSKLPSQRDADSALQDSNALIDMCNDCTGGMFPHECIGKWTRIRQTIRDDTQEALKAFSDETHIPLPAFHEKDMLVHVRLEPNHPQIAYYAKSFFAGLIPDGASRIILLSAEPEWGKPILESYMAIFHELCPQCRVERSSGDQFNDFAAIALAPTVVCSASTYCLWAAMANRGRAVMSSHLVAEGKMPPIDDWTWVPGHILGNAERPQDISDEDWTVQVAKWVREN